VTKCEEVDGYVGCFPHSVLAQCSSHTLSTLCCPPQRAPCIKTWKPCRQASRDSTYCLIHPGPPASHRWVSHSLPF